MFCPNCGGSNDPSVKFCGNCGHAFLNNHIGNQQNSDSLQSHDEQSLNPYFDEQQHHHFEQPGNQHQQPTNGGSFLQPGSGQFQRPDSNQFQQPSNQQFQRPFDGQFQQPESGQFKQPDNQQFQGPGNGQFQQPVSGQFQQTGSGQFHHQGNQQFQQPVNQQFQPNHPQRSNHKPPKKNMKVWIISGVAALLIVILAVSYGLFTYFNNQNSAKPNDDNNLGQMINNNKGEEKKDPVDDPEDEKDDKKGKDTKEEKEIKVVEEKEKTQIIKESMPKVFTIITQDGHGSGFLYSDGGYIVTNAHVVAGYSDVLVRNSAGQESPGTVIGISDTLDIALIQSDAYANTEPLPVENNTSDIGIEVIAIGSPQGFENSASIGYLTGTNREMTIDGYNFVYDELYQIDAQIDQGSSGGPLFDATTGKVIGINSIVYLNMQSFAFAIPVHTVTDYFDEWIDNPMSATEVTAVDVYAGYETDVNDLGEDYSDYWENENVDYGYYFDEETLSSFITSYFEYYEWSINDGDFYWVEDMISPDSNAYLELQRQIEDYYGSNVTFDYWYTEITSIDIFQEEGYAIVTTYEEYDEYDVNGEYTSYAETVEYYVTIDEYGYYLISDIYYYEVEQ